MIKSSSHSKLFTRLIMIAIIILGCEIIISTINSADAHSRGGLKCSRAHGKEFKCLFPPPSGDEEDANGTSTPAPTAAVCLTKVVDCKCEVTCPNKLKNCASKSCACQSEAETPITIQHITDEFIFHRRWLIKVVWEAHVLPALMLMTEQLSAMAMQQVMIIGTFFDAKHQLESQRLIQELQAQSHKDYHPSKGMCQFGTNTRALAASSHKTGLAQVAISTRIQSRNLLNAGGISGTGIRDDARSRMVMFRNFFCNKADMTGNMQQICNNADPTRINRDIDFSMLMDRAKTLDIDYANSAITNDETDILALATNLYGENLFPYIPEEKMALSDGRMIEKGASAYMDIRALTAKRSVAEASYAAQIAARTPGTGNVKEYMIALLREMGLTEVQAIEMIGENPSYKAQMDLIAKTLYQTPNFYTDLYDKPVNIDRKLVSMQAIGLMQNRDTYRSSIRREALESVALETMLIELEEEFKNDRARTVSQNNILNVNGLGN